MPQNVLSRLVLCNFKVFIFMLLKFLLLLDLLKKNTQKYIERKRNVFFFWHFDNNIDDNVDNMYNTQHVQPRPKDFLSQWRCAFG